MKHLLNLLAAVALLVWGTWLVRTGVLRVFGAGLRQFLARSLATRPAAAAAGVGVTALVQSSTATALIVSSFVAQGLVALPTALAVMLGADVGTSLMAVVFSLDLSWLSPLLILLGVGLFISRQEAPAGRVGRVLIGVGLMLRALRLIGDATSFIARAPSVKGVLSSLSSDVLLEIVVGAVLAMVAYSSLGIVLLTASLTLTGAVQMDVALGIVLGANVGSSLLALLLQSKSSVQARQVPLGNLLFRMIGVIPFVLAIGPWLQYVQPYVGPNGTAVVLFHLAFNSSVALAFLAFTGPVARAAQILLPEDGVDVSTARPRHLDATALATPSLAMSCAAREALHQADVVETMLTGMLKVLQTGDLRLASQLRGLEDTVDQLYSAIKMYLTKIPRESLSEEESRRWAAIIGFTIDMEQVADIVERLLIDIEARKIKPGRSFSPAGQAEIHDLHARLLENLQLGMSVLLTGHPVDAHRLLREKERFDALERAYADSHLARLAGNTLQSIETSSLHLDLISEFRRINSHICAIASSAA
jgi:phosphate:Na+ symporter